jgi:hypothetical protein
MGKISGFGASHSIQLIVDGNYRSSGRNRTCDSGLSVAQLVRALNSFRALATSSCINTKVMPMYILVECIEPDNN